MTQSAPFSGLGLAPNLLAIIEKLRFTTPTPIQERSIPIALQGQDLIGIAQTGTGKTLAFGLPMLQAALNSQRGLVVLPTRELALQVQEALNDFGRSLGLQTVLLIGGESIGRQIAALRRQPIILIGTPGRIIDHLEQKTLSLHNISILVLDEADRMLDMGFAPQLNRILAVVPKQRQTMLFSATMPQEIVVIARSHMRLPVRVEIAPPGTTSERVTQELFFVQKFDKPRLLEKILYDYHGSVLIFSRTKFGAKKITAHVRALGHTVSEIHSNKSLLQRRAALDGFKNGRFRILVATDIAARGIDVKGIELVLNYDLPDNPEDYIHRIGRTARAGGAGHAISFATPDQRGGVRDIERLMRVTLPTSKLPDDLPPLRQLPRQALEDYQPRRSFDRRPPRTNSFSPVGARNWSTGPARPANRPPTSRPAFGQPRPLRPGSGQAIQAGSQPGGKPRPFGRDGRGLSRTGSRNFSRSRRGPNRPRRFPAPPAQRS